jgi:hypothetical protein
MRLRWFAQRNITSQCELLRKSACKHAYNIIYKYKTRPKINLRKQIHHEVMFREENRAAGIHMMK